MASPRHDMEVVCISSLGHVSAWCILNAEKWFYVHLLLWNLKFDLRLICFIHSLLCFQQLKPGSSQNLRAFFEQAKKWARIVVVAKLQKTVC